MKLQNEKGLATIEASLTFTVFIFAYLILNNLLLGLYIEGESKKALAATAMEISNYSYFLEKYDKLAIIKIDDNDVFAGINEILNRNIRSPSEDNLYKILSDLKNLIYTSSKKEIGNKAKLALLKDLFAKNFTPNSFIVEKYIEGGYSGLNMQESKIYDSPGEVLLNIKYQINLSNNSIFQFKKSVDQQVRLNNTKLTNNEDSLIDSIWQEDNFTRGRYFLNELRKNSNLLVLKEGRGFDFINFKNKEILQAFSINIFEKTYSDKKNYTYVINEKKLKKQIQEYVQKAYKNLVEYEYTFYDSQNNKIEVAKDYKISTILIFPSNAKENSNLEEFLTKVQNIYNLKILYIQEAEV